MQHDDAKERQEASLVGRIFSLEGVILLMGVVSLIYGLVQWKVESIFWGVIILAGFWALLKVRKRDWKAHWEAMDRQQKQEPPRE